MAYDLTALGFKYPQSGETVQLWDHFRELAESIQDEYDNRPAAMIQATSAQAFANNTLTNVAFDASAGLAACIDLVNDRLLVPRDGLYRVDGCCSWTANGTGYRRQGITYHPSAGGGDAYVGVNDSVATSAISQSCPIVSKLVQCVAGDYFYMRAQQTSGGSLNSYVGLLGVFMSIQWVKP